jgi:nitrite reductase/ring-hydroxylating ferredoxin subunit
MKSRGCSLWDKKGKTNAEKMASWVKLFEDQQALEKALPEGALRKLKAVEDEICLARVNGAVYAIDDFCPHRGESLSKGKINYLQEVVCPLHHYRYRLLDGQECQERTGPVRVYPVEIREDGIYILI